MVRGSKAVGLWGDWGLLSGKVSGAGGGLDLLDVLVWSLRFTGFGIWGLGPSVNLVFFNSYPEP